MSTNFYTYCKCCGNDTYHLGQSAAADVKFALQANGFELYHDWPGMLRWLADKPIRDEYGRDVTLETFKEWVEGSQQYRDRAGLEFDRSITNVDGYEFHDGSFS